MDRSYYSVAQIAKMLRMHPKTIQRYIREGKLRAAKIGKGWRVSGHDLSRFMEENHETATPSVPLASPLANAKASAVIDIAVLGHEEAQRLISSLNAMMNGKPDEYGQASLYTQYIEINSAVRLSLWGSLSFTAAVLELVNTYLQKFEESTL